MASLTELLEKTKHLSDKDRALIRDAYVFAEKAHAGQVRYSGEPYFNHVFATAMNLASLDMNANIISAGLLHDTIEDTKVKCQEIEKKFGKDILFLVEGVTKLGKLKYRGLERDVENLRKFFVAIAADPRVIVIKLCDRLHNVRTLEFVRPDKQKRIALETLEIYAPLAHRLNMGKLRGLLEDAAFPFAYPKEYELVKRLLADKTGIGEKYLREVERVLKRKLKQENVKVLRLDERVKHLYSLYRKLKRYDMDIEKVYDIIALRVIVSNVEECYHTLGVIHGIWRPLPGKIKDYIATPKTNGYRSLHTTVFTGTGGIIEIQIRTMEMHQEAEFGISAHFIYKENPKNKKNNLKDKYLWINELRDVQKRTGNIDAFYQNLKMDFFKDRVFVFTPKGEVIDLPEDSSALDFAYAVHSAIGNHASGAKINGKQEPLHTKLKLSDIVEISVRKDAHPSDKWLEFTKTSIARNHIQKYLSKHTLAEKFKHDV